MNTHIKKTFTFCLTFFMLSSYEIAAKNNPLYLLILEKITQKNDLHSTLLDTAFILNKYSDEKVNIETIKNFIASDSGKTLKDTYHKALNPDRHVQEALSAVGLFLYDFYQLNILGDQTIEIGKIFELYLCSLHSIPTSLQFEKVITTADFVKKHRILHSQEKINNTLQTIKN